MTRIIYQNLVLVVVAFTTKRKDKASKANTKPFSEYFSVRKRIKLILCCLYMLSYGESKSDNIVRTVVKYIHIHT